MPYEYPFNTFPLVNKIRITNPAANLDARYGPWPTTLSALSAFDPVLRNVGLTVGIDSGSGVVEYWFKDGVADNNLIVKQVPLSATNILGGKPLTTFNDTNVVLTLSGTSSSALLNAVSLSASWSGQLPIGRGGTGASTQQTAINALAGAVTNAQFLRGNGSDVVMSAIQASDISTLNQNTTGSAATLTTARTLWGQSFNGSANVSGTLSAVGDIIGSGAITLSAGSGNNNINLTPSGTGLVTATGNLSASNRITARDITATNLLSAANTFTRALSVGDVQFKTVGTSNVFIGDSTTGNNNTTGNHNFVFGLSAGNALTSGFSNVFVGACAGASDTTGFNNIFFGNNAGVSNTTGSSNNFIGSYAGRRNTTGGNNNFLGTSAGRYNSIGGSNNFLGQNAGFSNSIGIYNNFLGQNAGFFNTAGGCNNFLGNQAGLVNTTGGSNNFFGTCAGRSNTTGSNNNFFGTCAGSTNTIGSNNIIIGNTASVATNALSSVIVLGVSATATASNQLAMGSTNWPLSTTATAGSAAGFLVINLNGTLRKIQFSDV